jgi:hypothetical protein
MNRNSFLKAICVIPAAFALRLNGAVTPQVTVFKTRTCGCCGHWVEHMKANGFNVIVQDVDDTSVYRHKYGVPDALASCHTAIVNGYAIEGHVPAADIQRLLKTRPPKTKGLAVPGMVMGSPGMEGPRSDAYSVVAFDADGRSSVFQTYPRK